MDLTLRRRVDNDLRQIFVTDATPTGNPVLDPVLQLMAIAPVLTPKPIGYWLHQLADQAARFCASAACGNWKRMAFSSAKTRRSLWMFGARGVTRSIHQKEQREVKLRVLGVVLRDDIPGFA